GRRVARRDLGHHSVGRLHPLRRQPRRLLAGADGRAAHHRADVLRRRRLLSRAGTYACDAAGRSAAGIGPAAPARHRRTADGALGLFMVIYGARLVEATWHQSIAEFPSLSVGVTYLPIPIGGAVILLFVIERLAIGAPGRDAAGAAAFD